MEKTRLGFCNSLSLSLILFLASLISFQQEHYLEGSEVNNGRLSIRTHGVL
jgi:hypothetical protein